VLFQELKNKECYWEK